MAAKVTNEIQYLESTNSDYELDLPSLPHSWPGHKQERKRMPSASNNGESPCINFNSGSLREAGPDISEEILSENDKEEELDVSDSTNLSAWIQTNRKNELAVRYKKGGGGVDADGEVITGDRDNPYTRIKRDEMQDNIYKSLNPYADSSIKDDQSGSSLGCEINYIPLPKSGSTAARRVPPQHAERWTLHRSVQRMMEAVGYAKNSCCCCSTSTPRKGAKRFYGTLAALIILLLMALVGVVVGTLGWILVQTDAKAIHTELDNYKMTASSCQVGQNWTSLVINASTPSCKYQFNTSSTHSNLALNDLLSEMMMNEHQQRDLRQLLVYIVLRTNATNDDDAANFTTDGSYVNFALWTERRHDKSYRQYMSIPNHSQWPFIISSRDFWFPIKRTNRVLYITANVLESTSDSPEMVPIDLIAYIAGYC